MSGTKDILTACAGAVARAFPNAKAGSRHEAALYLAHTDRGESIRALARATGAHPSTVLRTVRRVEDRRDDPLLDTVLGGIEAECGRASAGACHPALPALEAKTADPGRDLPRAPGQAPSEETVRREAKRFLRRLAEPGSILVIAPGAEKGGVFCAANQHRKPIAMLPVAMAAEFLRRDWIGLSARGQATTRYAITDVGRAWLRRTLAEEAEAKRARDGAGPFAAQHRLAGTRQAMDPVSGRPEQLAVNLGESPLGWLARRKGVDGRPFLAPAEVEAGERLRSDFEVAQMVPSVAQDWRKFLTPGDKLSGSPLPRGPAEGPSAARDRVSAALASLGPGLSDIAVRTCCFLEGLEASERRFGWSARSGKVVLKIALQRLAEHYGLVPARGEDGEG
ncbi:MAG TPA: DUF6456 domain-containing protein [Thermohalobaculum sp.]|nr:DUF6456 domain-containing protein [Thermohalobaculum sp.]